MWLVHLDLESEFAESLARATDSVLVWPPALHHLPPSALRRGPLAAVIRKRYRLEARLGRIEVWRRAIGPGKEGRWIRSVRRPREESLATRPGRHARRAHLCIGRETRHNHRRFA